MTYTEHITLEPENEELLADPNEFARVTSDNFPSNQQGAWCEQLPSDKLRILVTTQYENMVDGLNASDGAPRAYRIHFWKEGIGIANSRQFKTDIPTPDSRYFKLPFSVATKIEHAGRNFSTVTVNVACEERDWSKDHVFHVDWIHPRMSAFERKLRSRLNAHIKSRCFMDEDVQNVKITNSCIDLRSKVMAWQTAEQKRNGQTRYFVWQKKGDRDITLVSGSAPDGFLEAISDLYIEGGEAHFEIGQKKMVV